MGLSNFPSAAEGVLPIIVMNTVLSVAILKSLLKSVLEIISSGLNMEEDPPEGGGSVRRRRVSITQFKSLCESQASEITTASKGVECSVCLNRFEEEEEVSELSCKHFFHRRCLEKWFDNHHSTCPLCRYRERRWELKQLIASGGMPSSHSATVTALATDVGLQDGIGSSLFATAAILACIVMYDAFGVRLQAGRQAEVLNQIVYELPAEYLLAESRPLRELLGHTPPQIIAGALLGIITSTIVRLIVLIAA